MAIQKLFPTYYKDLPYPYYNLMSGGTFRNVFGTSSYALYSGSTIGIAAGGTQNNGVGNSFNHIVPYISKSLTLQDDNSYIGLATLSGTGSSASGSFIPGINEELRVYAEFGLTNPVMSGDYYIPRFRYSGLPLIESGTFLRTGLNYDIYIVHPNIEYSGAYATVASYNYWQDSSHDSPISYSGDSLSSFVDITLKPIYSDGFASWTAYWPGGEPHTVGQRVEDLISMSGQLRFKLDLIMYSGEYKVINDTMAFSAFEILSSGDIFGKSVNMHTYSAPIGSGLDFHTKRHGYINSIEEVTRSGAFKVYPTAGTYANGSGALFEIFPSDYTTYRTATGYSGATSEVITPAFAGDNPMVRYIRESTDSPENISYIGLTNYVTSLTGHSNTLNVAIGTQLDSLNSLPKSLKTNMTYSGVPNLLSPNIYNLKSQYFLTLDNTAYEIGYASQPVPQLLNYLAYSFVKVPFPELFLDGTPQPSASNTVYISGDLLQNLISSGATFSTYTTMNVTSNYVFGYKNHGISAFDVDVSGGTYIEYIPHPSLYMSGAYPEKSVDMILPGKSGTNHNLTLYTSGNNQINNNLTLALPFPSFDNEPITFHTIGEYLTSFPMYIEAGHFQSNTKNLTLYIENHSGTAINSNVNFHTISRVKDSGILDMYLASPLIGNKNKSIDFKIHGHDAVWSGVPMYTLAPLVGYSSGNLNLYLKNGQDDVHSSTDLFLRSVVIPDSGVTRFHIYSAILDSGGIDLYIGGDKYGMSSGVLPLVMLTEMPHKSIQLLVYQNTLDDNLAFPVYLASFIESSGSLNMYTLAPSTHILSGDIPLYMNSYEPTKSINLFVKNYILPSDNNLDFILKNTYIDSGELPIYINGGGIDLKQGALNMSLKSFIEKSGDVNMSIMGNLAFGNIDFTIYSKDVDRLNNETDFFINASSSSGLLRSFDMYVQSINHNTDIPFYMPTSSIGNTSGELAFYMLNDTTLNKDVLFCIYNNLETKEAGYTLFTQGNGITYGGGVANSSMNLFINRGNESISNSVQMIVNGPSGETNNVPFYLNGGYITDSGIVLNMPNVTGPNSGIVEMYTHGF